MRRFPASEPDSAGPFLGLLVVSIVERTSRSGIPYATLSLKRSILMPRESYKDPLHSSNKIKSEAGLTSKDYLIVERIPFGPIPTIEEGMGVVAVSVPSALIVNLEI